MFKKIHERENFQERCDLLHRISELKHLLIDEIFDVQTTKAINEEISKTEKELKALLDKE